VHLIYNIDFIFGSLWCIAHLVYQRAYIINRVVGCGIQLVYIKRVAVVKGIAAFALVAGLNVLAQVLAVDGFGKYTRACCFTHTPGPAKQKGLRQVIVFYGIFKRVGNMALAHHGIKSAGPVFACRNYKILHLRLQVQVYALQPFKENFFALFRAAC